MCVCACSCGGVGRSGGRLRGEAESGASDRASGKVLSIVCVIGCLVRCSVGCAAAFFWDDSCPHFSVHLRRYHVSCCLNFFPFLYSYCSLFREHESISKEISEFLGLRSNLRASSDEKHQRTKKNQ